LKKRHLHNSLLKVRNNGQDLYSVQRSLGAHKDIVLAAVMEDDHALHYANEIFKNDPDIIFEIIKNGKNGIRYAHEDLRRDVDLVLMSIENDINAFVLADPMLKKDRDFLLKALKLKGMLLVDCKKLMTIDEEMMLIAIQNDGNAMLYTSKSFQANEAMALLASKTAWTFLKNSPFRNHREIVLNAVKNSWEALRFASSEIEADEEIYQIAKKQCLMSISPSFSLINSLSPRLRNDRDIFEKIIEQTGKFVSYIGDELKNDQDFILKIQSKTKETILAHVSEKLKDIREIVMCDLEKDILQIRFASQRFLDDVDLFKNLIDQGESVSRSYWWNKYESIWAFIKLAGPSIHDHLEIMKFFVKNDPHAFVYASDRLKRNEEIIYLLLSHYGSIKSVDSFMSVDGTLSIEKLEIYKNWHLLSSASDEIKNDQAFLKEVLTQCIYALEFVDTNLKKDPDFMLSAVKRSWEAIFYVSGQLANYDELVKEAERQNKNMFPSIPKIKTSKSAF
jgi:hypothetical protein